MGYNALLDPHLVGYLDSKTMFRNLRKAGLVDKNKRVKDEDELRQWCVGKQPLARLEGKHHGRRGERGEGERERERDG